MNNRHSRAKKRSFRTIYLKLPIYALRGVAKAYVKYLEVIGLANKTPSGMAVKIPEKFPGSGRSAAILFLIYYAVQFAAVIVAKNASSAYIHSQLADFFGVEYVQWRLVADVLLPTVFLFVPDLLVLSSVATSDDPRMPMHVKLAASKKMFEHSLDHGFYSLIGHVTNVAVENSLRGDPDFK